MTNALKFAGVAVAGIVVGLLLSAFSGGHLFGGVYSQVAQVFPSIKVDDANGTAYKLIKSGTCTLQANFSIAATSTRNVSCTGISGYTGAAGDIVRLQLAASTTLASQYLVKSATASTTVAGSIEAALVNMTGTAAVPAATNGFGSSTVYQVFRPQ